MKSRLWAPNVFSLLMWTLKQNSWMQDPWQKHENPRISRSTFLAILHLQIDNRVDTIIWYARVLSNGSIIISSAHSFGLMNYGVTEPISLKRVALEMRTLSCLMICDIMNYRKSTACINWSVLFENLERGYEFNNDFVLFVSSIIQFVQFSFSKEPKESNSGKRSYV